MTQQQKREGHPMGDTPTFENISFTREGAVAVLALNRPEKYNAVNLPMHHDLQAALKLVARDQEIRALVLTGEGKAFCAGQDLTEFGIQGEDFRIDEHIRKTFNAEVLALRALPIPVIAAVNGVAAGAGASLALAADMRIMSTSGSLLQAFIKIGLAPDTGSTWFLPELVGVSRALELAWSGEPVGAERCLELGLANAVVAPEELLPHTLELATKLAAMPTFAIGLTKRAMYRSLNVDLANALEYEAQIQQAAVASHDHHEGLMAFLEKREPAFTGR
jgi:2-(1,2-epoxy-1,2-dihydrophenyl)acetyl-CoA isomerase